MKDITENSPSHHRAQTGAPPLWRRLAWFVALWVMGVITVGTVALLLRWLLKPAGS